MHDLIERQAAIEAIWNSIGSASAVKKIENLPSAQPEPCEDTISRKAAVDSICRTVCDNPEICESQCEEIKVLEIMPSAQQDLSEYSDKLWRNAYERGKAEAQAEIVRCRECRYYKSDGCFFSTAVTSDDGFCHWAERRTDEGD